MKNIKITHLIIINLLLVLIIYFNFAGSFLNKKKYTFERNYKSSVLKPLEDCIKVSDSTFTPTFPSDIPNTFSSKIFKNHTDFNFTFYDMSVHKISSKNFQLKNNLFPLYILKDSVLCVDESAHLFVNNHGIPFKNLKVSSIKKFKDDYYILGEYAENNYFTFGFFKLNLFLSKLTLIETIQKSKNSLFAENALKYNGNFFGSIDGSEEIIYATNKSSLLWIFKNFRLINKINTLDKTPLPNIIKKGDIFVYGRDNTYNTNMASFTYKNQLHIFSNRNTEKKKIVIDVYDLKGDYIYSYILPKTNDETQNILQIFTDENKIIIAFENNCFSLFTI
ncbi:MAG: hypothetical protein LBE36_04415 [Flavobacteriaceae bacterium]|jgi:hypothetical protein|nr:hypothetical protein [Flavobacteriaceae bacterium]